MSESIVIAPIRIHKARVTQRAIATGYAVEPALVLPNQNSIWLSLVRRFGNKTFRGENFMSS